MTTDVEAVNNLSFAMKVKLAEKRAEGFSGWQRLTDTDLTFRLVHHLLKGDPVDVANYCAMLYQTGQKINVATVYGCICGRATNEGSDQ